MSSTRPHATQTLWSGPEIRNLDLLRAVAVLCVFLAHLFLFLINRKYVVVSQALPWEVILDDVGHIGVLFFFVHTALVLMLSLDRTTGRRPVLNFYLRRAFRIYPLSIACVLIVLVLRVPQVPEVHFVAFDWKEIASNLLLIQNITQQADVIMPLWTLTREVQMYLALPLIYWIVRRFRSSITSLILWLGFFAAVPHAPLLSCFPCFMGGVFAYQLARERVFRVPAALWPPAILGLLLLHIVLSMTILPDYRNDFILCMFLGAVIPNVVDLSASWLTRASHAVAKYSYGVYLFHTPIIWFSFVKLGFLPVPLRYAMLAVLMCVIPMLAYHLLEAPLIEAGRRLALRVGQVHASTAPIVVVESDPNPMLLSASPLFSASLPKRPAPPSLS